MGRILDISGQPFDFDDEMQTRSDELAMVMKRTQEHPSSGVTPNRAAQMLRDAERGDLTAQADLAFDMEEKDTHLFSELSKRRLAIQALEWRIAPARDASAQEKKDADMLNEYLHDAAWFEDALFDAGDAILKGYSMQEIEWGWLGKMRVPVALHHRDPALFCANPDNLNELRLRDASYHGLELQPFGWFMHRAKSRTGYVGTNGLVRTLTRTAFSTWNRLAQRFERRHAATAGRQGAITTSYNSPVAEKNIATLNYVMLAAAQTYRAEAASQALTAALDFSRRMDNAARAPVLDAPSTTTGTASGASSTSATVTQGQLQLTAITPDGGFSQVSFSDSGTVTPPVFESVSDIGKTAAMLGAALDTVILTASEQGFSTDSVQLTQLRLLVVADLEKRGLQLAGSETHRLPETMPAMVALYRYTGNSRNWQRLARRNGISNPLFVPGGVSIEVINE